MKSLASQFLVAILFLILAILHLRDAIIAYRSFPESPDPLSSGPHDTQYLYYIMTHGHPPQHDFYWNLFGAFLYLIVFILICRHIMRNMRAGR
jgi:hypothetical protein